MKNHPTKAHPNNNPCPHKQCPIPSQSRTNGFIEFEEKATAQSIAERFEEQTEKYPKNLAVKTDEFELTYELLNQRTNRFGRYLLSSYKDCSRPIALLVDHGAPMIIGMLGVLKAGKFYIPMEPLFPYAKNNKILTDSKAGLIVSNNRNLDTAKKLAGERLEIINIDNSDPNISCRNLNLSISPDDFCHILYTSGSTGSPKGVVHTHRTLLQNILNNTNHFKITAEDQLTLFASCSTAQAITNIYGALLNGAALFPWHVKEKGFTNLELWLSDSKITLWWSSASIFRYFFKSLSDTKVFPWIRLIKLGSELVHKKDVELYAKRFGPGCVLVNALSSTEAGTFRINIINHDTRIKGVNVAVGYGVAEKEILVIDDKRNALGFNKIGEIAVKSRYLAQGYWRKPRLTESTFLPDPHEGKARIYRTGDLGRMLPDGCLEYLGRKGSRIKIRGNRVETTEIEVELLNMDAINAVYVDVKEDQQGEHQLVAYLVSNPDRTPSSEDMSNFLKQKLPEYMVPADFVNISELPLTTSGKIDRQALPMPKQYEAGFQQNSVEPQTPLQKELASHWCDILSLKKIGIYDNFFNLGGSLLKSDAGHLAYP